jgi:hypothetical protein
MQPDGQTTGRLFPAHTVALAQTLERRTAPRIDAEGLHFRCRPVDPRRWWRADGVVGWIDDLSATGARLRMHPNLEAKRRSRWTLRVGRLEGEAEIVHVSSLAVGLQGLTIGVRFIELEPALGGLIAGLLAGTSTPADWTRALREPT